ncbi:MAG: peroxiredoxin [Myxococcota bacterium]|jgi:peroxiredoxin
MMAGWWISMVGAALATTPVVSVGQHALTFSLPVVNADQDEEAPRITLAQYVGVRPKEPQEAVVLYFFSRREGSAQLADLSRIQKRYAGQGLQILGISTDAGAVGGLSAWLDDQALAFPVLRDNHQIVTGRYGFEKVPVAVLIDEQGYIFAVGQPDAADFSADLEAELAALLND